MSKIDGGATLWARKTLESEIFTGKPAEWFKIWFYVVNKANHSDNKSLKRGQCFLKYDRITEATRANRHQIDHFIRWAKKERMLATQKATRGMVVTVLNYDEYQTLGNYKSDTESDLKATQKRHRSDTINKNDKNDKNEKNKKNKEPPLPPREEFPEWMNEKLWKRFLNHRKAVKAPIQKDSWESFFRKFQKLREEGWESEQVVDILVEKGWRWFNPDWIKEGPDGKQKNDKRERSILWSSDDEDNDGTR